MTRPGALRTWNYGLKEALQQMTCVNILSAMPVKGIHYYSNYSNYRLKHGVLPYSPHSFIMMSTFCFHEVQQRMVDFVYETVHFQYFNTFMILWDLITQTVVDHSGLL